MEILNLYGDGIHDDTDAIQAMLDSSCEVCLPDPKKYYLISRPLEIGSNTKLRLPRFAEIRLADASNCVMLKNKTVSDKEENIALRQKKFEETFKPSENYWTSFRFATVQHNASVSFSSAEEDCCYNIEVEGGIWNYNNKNQKPNPMYTFDHEPYGYCGIIFQFFNVKNLRVANLTLKDPITFATMFDYVSYFTVENIVFDFNYGNPKATNMDGIHVNGGCHYGRICNLQGACYDDLVALNADEGRGGPITDIDIEGIFAQDCHSAVRLLSVNKIIERISVSKVHGTYFQYCIGFTKFYKMLEGGGYMDAITVDKIYASKAPTDCELYAKGPKDNPLPLFFVEEGVIIKNLFMSNIYREEKCFPCETFYVGEGATVEDFILKNVVDESRIGEYPIMCNKGKIGRLEASNIKKDGKQVSLKTE